MSERVSGKRIGVAAGVLVALYVVTIFIARPVPDWIVSVLGGPRGLEREGGLRVHYRPPGGDVQVIDYPRIALPQVPDVLDVLVGGGLSMREVLESEVAMRTGIPEGDDQHPDPTRVTLEVDSWRSDDGDGGIHTVTYLVGPSPAAIEAALADATTRGWTLPAGSSIGYELVEPHASNPELPPYWRTYELANEVLIDGAMIASATRAYDPNTNRPLVLIDFTEQGAQRFCDVTRQLGGRKLATILGGRIRSAPIINGAICGGRASITMGGSDPRTQEREADALVAVLAQGARPAGGVIEKQEYLVPPAQISSKEWSGRLLLGLLAGLAFGLVTFGVLRVARPTWRTPSPSPAGGVPWRRVAVTLLAPVSLIIGGKLTLPGVNELELMHITRADLGTQFSVIAIGIMPILTSFVIVELVALAVPPWRWRRHDVRGRIGLGKAVAVVSMLTALIQAYFVVTYLEALNRGGAQVVGEPGWKLRIVVIGSLVGGTALLSIVAGLIREHGLGNGYGALIVSASAIALLHPIAADPAMLGDYLGPQQLVALVTAVAIAAATTCVLRWRITQGDREPALRMPLSGVSPVSDSGGLMTLVFTLSALGLGVALHDVAPWVFELQARTGLSLAMLVSSIALYAWLFARPSVVERVAMQASLDRPARSSWLRALLVTAWLLLGAGLLSQGAPYDVGSPGTELEFAL